LTISIFPRGVHSINDLRIEDFPAGHVSRTMVDLFHDSMSEPVSVPVLVARGSKPGPTLGLTAALHGNELNGISVIRRLFAWLDPTHLRGNVVGVLVANVPGYHNNERTFMGEWDLNHLFPGREDGHSGQVYAHRLLTRLVSKFDMLFDLHTASFGRVNSLYVRANMTEEETSHMAYLQRPQIIVHNPPSDQTLRGAAAELGMPAITTEIGNPQRFHRDYIKRTLSGIRAVMAHRRMIRGRPPSKETRAIVCRRSFWIYTDHGGVLEVLPGVTDMVKQGECIAQLTDPFGDVLRRYEAPCDGIVIGRSVNPAAYTGARILHLGELATEEDTHLVRRDSVPAVDP